MLLDNVREEPPSAVMMQDRGIEGFDVFPVKFDAEGKLEFVGRVDQQVKVRGYRIELEEIEAVVMQHARVREAMVIDKQDAAGDSYLSCYLAADDGFDIEELRTFVGQKLPHYMMPAYFTVLPSLPDRKSVV